MFARIEVSLKPELFDPVAQPLLRRMEMTDPELRKKVRWARSVDVFWIDIPLAREEFIYASNEAVWDPTLFWLFTGNLIPSAAGKKGGIEDLLETAPNRPGKFFVIEKRYRPNVNDAPARTLVEAFEAVLKRKIPGVKIFSGGMLVLEGPGLDHECLSRIAREYYSNELLESWTLLNEKEILNSERFHPERIKREIPKPMMPRFAPPIERLPITQLSAVEVQSFAKKQGIQLKLMDIEAIQKKAADDQTASFTDAELSVLAAVWNTQMGERWMRGEFDYQDASGVQAPGSAPKIPNKIPNLLHATVEDTLQEVPRNWVVSAFEGQPSLIAFDQDDLFAIEGTIESHALAHDAQYGAMWSVCEASLRSTSVSRGAKPIALIDQIFSSELHLTPPQGVDHLHPRRVLDGVKQGLSTASSHLGIPIVGGSVHLDTKEGTTPVIHLTEVSWLPKVTGTFAAETREFQKGDLIYLLGSETGREGLLASPAIQIPDTRNQKRLIDFIIEMRESHHLKLVAAAERAGLAGAITQVALETGGVEIDLSQVKLRTPMSRASDVLQSQTPGRVLVVVPQSHQDLFESVALKREILFVKLGEVEPHHKVSLSFAKEKVVDLPLEFIKKGAPMFKTEATWLGPKDRARNSPYGELYKEGVEALLRVLSHPSQCSREWLIRQFDHEVQGMSVLKPLHSVSYSAELSISGPNDGAALKPKPALNEAFIISTGVQPRFAQVDPAILGRLTVDEAIRNALACGADYGKEENVFALSYQLSWPDKDTREGELSAALVRALYGASEAATELQTPFVSGLVHEIVDTSARWHFVVQSFAKSAKLGGIKSVDFKTPGDWVYLLGPAQFALRGSLFAELMDGAPEHARVPEPHWDVARRLYAWLGLGIGKEQKKLRSIHDVSEGGWLAAIAESCIARNLGVQIDLPASVNIGSGQEWEYCFGEGFHNFIISVGELDASVIEAELAQHEIPFVKLGVVSGSNVVQVKQGPQNLFAVETKVLRQAWRREGYWE